MSLPSWSFLLLSRSAFYQLCVASTKPLLSLGLCTLLCILNVSIFPSYCFFFNHLLHLYLLSWSRLYFPTIQNLEYQKENNKDALFHMTHLWVFLQLYLPRSFFSLSLLQIFFLAQRQCLFYFHLECPVHNVLLLSFSCITLDFLPLQHQPSFVYFVQSSVLRAAPRVIALDSRAAGDCLFNHDQSSGENWVFFLL